MTTLTQPLARDTASPHRLLLTGVWIALFWLVAAGLVAAAHLQLDPRSAAAAALAAAGALLATAYCYTRLCAPSAGITHALAVGIAWLFLVLVTEIFMSWHTGHPWNALLGSPARPLLRNVFLFIWIFTPAAFAHREES